MSEERTAFKHPNCGGVILQLVQNDVTIFTCDRCGESAKDIDQLVIRSLVIIRTRSNNQPDPKRTAADNSPWQGEESSRAVSDVEN